MEPDVSQAAKTARAIHTRGWARARLREATATEHARVDAAYSRFDLSMTADYRRFLSAQYRCVAATEAALATSNAGQIVPDWSERRRTDLLADDLAELGVARPALASPPSLDDPSAVLGAVYVLEGARFGGQVLARRLAAHAPSRFCVRRPHAALGKR